MKVTKENKDFYQQQFEEKLRNVSSLKEKIEVQIESSQE